MGKNRLNPQSARATSRPRSPEAILNAENVSAQQHSNSAQAARSRGKRKLVLCFDGTGNKFQGDDSDSNILKIFRMLDRTAGDQYHYYQPGIGTYVVSDSLTHTGVRARIRSWYTKAKDSAVGSSFDQHVVGGYRFLMRFYEPGDEIYFFGFSRGAYIARFLAEMLDYIGLLSHGNEEMVKFAWKAFSQWQCRQQDSGSDQEAAQAEAEKHKMFNFLKSFRETFSRPVGRVRFLGLFDTVNSVPRFETAWMQRSKFPYTARSSAKVIRHAVSIDERRAKFRQDLIYQSNPAKASRKPRHALMGDLLQHLRPRSSAARDDGTSTTRVGDDEVATHGHDEKRGASHPLDENNSINREASRTEKSDAIRRYKSTESRGRRSHKLLSPEQKAREDEMPTPYRKRSSSRRQQTQGGDRQTSPRPPQADNISEISDMSHSNVYGCLDEDENGDGDQDIDEVWFAGGHADVGGGWSMDSDRKSASHVPLAWIVREAMRAGLNFDVDKVAEMGCSCWSEWDGLNPSKMSEAVKKQRQEERKRQKEQQNGRNRGATMTSTEIPTLQVQDSNMEATALSIPDSPVDSKEITLDCCHTEGTSDPDSDQEDDKDHDEKLFEGLMTRAHTSRIHDALSFGGGLSTLAVAGWKFMEWLPFLRMDLQPDGSWEPIRWPLPRGEVRDVPMDVRVHGSVIRRMREDSEYRPGNLIIGGGGRGVKRAPEEYGWGKWICVAEKGDAIGEIWQRAKGGEECEVALG